MGFAETFKEICHLTNSHTFYFNRFCRNVDNEVIEDDDDINLESFGDELDAPPGFRDKNHPIQVEDEEDEDDDDDNDASG
uniref:Uncharacterized protein n=1 Tax=Quercus lobata TaxID=97700 RepID=A0A7N2M3Z7_QUELO